MRLHANAKLSVKGRQLLVDRVQVAGWSLTQAAEAAGVSDRTARKWLQRGWLDLRGRIKATDDLTLLREILENEEEIRRRYEGVRVHLQGPLASLAQRQFEGLLATGRQLHTLKGRITTERAQADGSATSA